MTKEKLIALENYKRNLMDRLQASIPSKHKGHPETYRAYLRNEIRMVALTIDEVKLVGVK